MDVDGFLSIILSHYRKLMYAICVNPLKRQKGRRNDTFLPLFEASAPLFASNRHWKFYRMNYSRGWTRAWYEREIARRIPGTAETPRGAWKHPFPLALWRQSSIAKLNYVTASFFPYIIIRASTWQPLTFFSHWSYSPFVNSIPKFRRNYISPPVADVI